MSAYTAKALAVHSRAVALRDRLKAHVVSCSEQDGCPGAVTLGAVYEAFSSERAADLVDLNKRLSGAEMHVAGIVPTPPPPVVVHHVRDVPTLERDPVLHGRVDLLWQEHASRERKRQQSELEHLRPTAEEEAERERAELLATVERSRKRSVYVRKTDAEIGLEVLQAMKRRGA